MVNSGCESMFDKVKSLPPHCEKKYRTVFEKALISYSVNMNDQTEAIIDSEENSQEKRML